MRHSLMLVTLVTAAAVTQIDEARARQYFQEAAALCEGDAGALWGVSLCGPIVIGDPKTRGIVTSQAAPKVPPPPAVGFANAALDWGGTRWTTLSWPIIPQDQQRRARLLMHELFHRIQPTLGLLVPDLPNPHLDTTEGRYWLRLEWRALAAALAAEGSSGDDAVADALAFRAARRRLISGSAASERTVEITEGLAQYTGTVLAVPSRQAAVADAIEQLKQAERQESFVRTFAYPSGAAYGLLLDRRAPQWRRSIRGSDDLGQLIEASGVRPAADLPEAERRYGGETLRAAEQARAIERERRIADLARRFVEGPIVITPRSNNMSFVTNGMTPLPGAGTVYPSVRAVAEWGVLEASQALVAADRSTIRVAGPPSAGDPITGEGWTLRLADGWVLRPGPRPGDVTVQREQR
jgi:hypothetical protein